MTKEHALFLCLAIEMLDRESYARSYGTYGLEQLRKAYESLRHTHKLDLAAWPQGEAMQEIIE